MTTTKLTATITVTLPVSGSDQLDDIVQLVRATLFHAGHPKGAVAGHLNIEPDGPFRYRASRSDDGTSGQDRESYSDDQDRDSYVPDSE